MAILLKKKKKTLRAQSAHRKRTTMNSAWSWRPEVAKICAAHLNNDNVHIMCRKSSLTTALNNKNVTTGAHFLCFLMGTSTRSRLSGRHLVFWSSVVWEHGVLTRLSGHSCKCYVTQMRVGVGCQIFWKKALRRCKVQCY